MKYTFQELTEEEISKLNSKQLQKKIEEIGEIYNVLRKMSEIIVEKKISEIASNYDIEYIEIITNYVYQNDIYFDNRFDIEINNDPYSGIKKIIPSLDKNIEEISFYDLEQKIYKELAPLRYFIKKNISFDASELKIKYSNQKLEKNTFTKKNKTKSLQQNNLNFFEFEELTEKEIFKLDPEQLQAKTKEIEKIYNLLDKMVEPIVKKKLNEIVSCYDVKTVEIKLYYLPSKEDYDSYYKIRIGGGDWRTNIPKYSKDARTRTFSSLRHEIYEELSPLKHLIQNDMSFDISKLRTKNMYYKFEEGIQTKNSQKSLRYKL